MKMKKTAYAGNHQVVVFWLGVLTGALVVGFSFFYGMMKMDQYQTAVYRSNLLRLPSYTTTLTSPTTTFTSPTSTLNLVDTKAIGGDGVGF